MPDILTEEPETDEIDAQFEKEWESSTVLDYRAATLKEIARLWFMKGRIFGMTAGMKHFVSGEGQ